MKQVHGYRKGECDPKEGRQLTICGRPVYQIDRYTILVHGDQHLPNKITCSVCRGRLAARTNYITKHTG